MEQEAKRREFKELFRKTHRHAEEVGLTQKDIENAILAVREERRKKDLKRSNA